ncbi:MAG: sigma-70 family RNA polymerase sigma factor, partial [Bacteroidetes bacterium]|nr:sigma-70 family RNA polymerase sigma factor [Bacteroidota bacterium]
RLVSMGDANAFLQIFHHYNALLLPFVLMLTGSQQTTQEILQDILLAVWQQREKLASVQQHRAWIFRVAANKAISYMRKQAAEGKLFRHLVATTPAADHGTANALAARETAALIEQAIQSLPPVQQKVYRLSREQQLSIAEIAAIQGSSPNTVKNQLVSALRSVKSWLEKGLYLLLAGCCLAFS